MDALTKKALEALNKNHFRTWFAPDRGAAEALFWEEIWDPTLYRVVSWGDSMTLQSLGIQDKLRKDPSVRIIETFDPQMSDAERNENRRRALLSDLFLSGCNAITASGQLVNLDRVGNRVGGVLYGPQKVVLFAGVNKIVSDLEGAFNRIKTVAAPLNARRHPQFKTPCQVAGKCLDCDSPSRICNAWTILEKSFPPGRIGLILIDEALGL